MKILGILLLPVALVMSGKPICHDPETSECSIITCGAPGRDGQKGEPGPRGPPGFTGARGPPGDFGGSEYENIKTNMRTMEEQLKVLQTSLLFFKGRARSGNKLYLSDGSQGTFEDAEARCVNAGGRLPMPRNADENEAIQSIRDHYGVFAYLGMREFQSKRIFRYLSGEEITYTNWYPNEPNNSEGKKEECVEMWEKGKWNDCICGYTRLIICEFYITGGTPGDFGDSEYENIKTNMRAMEDQLKVVQTSFLFFNGRARSGNKLYLSDGSQGTFEDAEARCANAGGRLPMPRNADENEAILSIRDHYGVFAYLGMREFQSKRIFRYLSGEEITYTNWSPNEPNNFEGKKEECVEMWEKGKWNDCICGYTRLVICEFYITG